uniref:Uncharacterized protein n=1 Tax=viral metagenome TaxID=1070528 RepID=A0A6M3LF10_9ZZZZ
MNKDTERINWLEKKQGKALVSDDFGHWAVVEDGMQNIPDSPPDDIQTTFFIEKEEWKKSIREAIDSAIKEEMERET